MLSAIILQKIRMENILPWDGDWGKDLCSSLNELAIAFDTKFFKFGDTFDGGIAKLPGRPLRKFNFNNLAIYFKKNFFDERNIYQVLNLIN